MIYPVYLVIEAILLILLIGAVVAAVMPGIEQFSRCIFIATNSVFMLCIGVSVIDIAVYANPDMVTVERVVIFSESMLMSMPFLLMTIYLLHSCGERWSQSAVFRAVAALWLVFVSVLVAAQFTDDVYCITSENLFNRGPWYSALLTPMVLIVFVDLMTLWHNRSRMSDRYFYAFQICLLPSLAAILIQMYTSTILVIDIVIAISSLAMFAIIMTDQIEQYMRQKKEIERQRASIMVLQMRPHFIYNTMTSIYYLCEQDPKKAQQVTLDFTTYLRKNFTAIASENTIPFSEELEHTRAYLAVEQAQFEDRLFVQYDIRHSGFRVPPLTLQPIVENAVKHGMDPDADPLHIFIQSRETDSGSIFIVEDNGSGYEPVNESGDHITLNNIKQRLEMMCGGTLVITSAEAGGTRVKVTIPYNEN